LDAENMAKSMKEEEDKECADKKERERKEKEIASELKKISDEVAEKHKDKVVDEK